jgi:hypothetical protein
MGNAVCRGLTQDCHATVIMPAYNCRAGPHAWAQEFAVSRARALRLPSSRRQCDELAPRLVSACTVTVDDMIVPYASSPDLQTVPLN